MAKEIKGTEESSMDPVEDCFEYCTEKGLKPKDMTRLSEMLKEAAMPSDEEQAEASSEKFTDDMTEE